MYGATKDYKYMGRFQNFKKDLQNGIIEKYADDEIFKQCIDTRFGYCYYRPEWAVSNYGRVYSLAKKKFITIYQKELSPNQKKKTNKKYYYCGGVLVHKLVAIYHCDKKYIMKYGVNNCRVDHTPKFDETKSNEENNNYKTLSWIPNVIDYDLIMPLENGTFTNSKKVRGFKDNIKEGIPIYFEPCCQVIDLRGDKPKNYKLDIPTMPFENGDHRLMPNGDIISMYKLKGVETPM